MKSVLPGFRNIFRNRGRLIMIVTLLGVSLMFVAAMTSLSANSQQELATVHQLVGTSITIRYVSSEANAIQQPIISQGGNSGFSGNHPTPIPDSVATKVKQVRGVVSTQMNLTRMDMYGSLQGSAISGSNGQSMRAPLSVNGIATDASSFTIMGGITPTLVAGRGFRSSDVHANVALISQAVAQANQLKVGSTFNLKETTFTVIGLYTTSNQLADSSVIIPMAAMEKVFQVSGVDNITATASSYEQVEAVAARLRQALGKQFDVSTQTSRYSQVFSALQTAQQIIEVARVVSFVIAAIVTVFAVLQLVRERTTEIAIQKALGSSHLQVLRQFWLEILLLSVTAAALAILLLVTLGPFIAQRFDIDAASLVKTGKGTGSPGGFFLSTGNMTATTASNPLSGVHLTAATLTPQTLLIIIGAGIGLALLTSLIPVWSVSTLKPAKVLRRGN